MTQPSAIKDQQWLCVPVSFLTEMDVCRTQNNAVQEVANRHHATVRCAKLWKNQHTQGSRAKESDPDKPCGIVWGRRREKINHV